MAEATPNKNFEIFRSQAIIKPPYKGVSEAYALKDFQSDCAVGIVSALDPHGHALVREVQTDKLFEAGPERKIIESNQLCMDALNGHALLDKTRHECQSSKG